MPTFTFEEAAEPSTFSFEDAIEPPAIDRTVKRQALLAEQSELRKQGRMTDFGVGVADYAEGVVEKLSHPISSLIHTTRQVAGLEDPANPLPIVPTIPKAEPAANVPETFKPFADTARGYYNAAANLVNAVVQPDYIGALGAGSAPLVARAALGAVFGGSMTQALPEQAERFGESTVNGGLGEQVEEGLNTVVLASGVVLPIIHSGITSERKSPPIERKANEILPASEPVQPTPAELAAREHVGQATAAPVEALPEAAPQVSSAEVAPVAANPIKLTPVLVDKARKIISEGESHSDALKRNLSEDAVDAFSNDAQHLFRDQDGNLLTREEAAKAIGKEGALQSADIPEINRGFELQESQGPETLIKSPEEGAIPSPAPTTKSATRDKVTAAAVINKETGEIYTGSIHAIAEQKAVDLGEDLVNLTSGFITDSGVFIDPKEAYNISVRSKQFTPSEIELAANKEGVSFDPSKPRLDGLTIRRLTRESNNRNPVSATTPEPAPVEPPKLEVPPPVEPPAVPTVPEPAPEIAVVGIKNSINDQSRIDRGLEPVEKRAAQEVGVPWEEAGKRIEDNPNAGPELVQSIIENPRLRQNEVDQAILLRHRVKLENDIHRENRKAFDENSPAEGRPQAELDLSKLLDQLDALEHAESYSGTTAGRTLNFRKQLAREDYSLVRILGKARLKKGEALTAEEIQGFKKQSEAWEKSEADIATKQAEAEAKQAVSDAESARKEAASSSEKADKKHRVSKRSPQAEKVIAYISELASPARERLKQQGKTYFGSGSGFEHLPNIRDYFIVAAEHLAKSAVKFVDRMVAEFGEGVRPHLKFLRKGAQDVLRESAAKLGNIDHKAQRDAISEGIKESVSEGAMASDLGGYARKLAENFISEEVTKGRKHADVKGEEIDSAVHAVLKEAIPDITIVEARDAWTGHGKFKALDTSSAVKVRLREASTEQQNVSKIEQLEKGLRPKQTGFERQTQTDLAKRQNKVINELKKKLPELNPVDSATRLKSTLDAIHTRNKNRIAELRFENATRKRIVKDKTPSPSDTESIAQRAEIDRLVKENREIFGDRDITPEERLKRAISASERAEVEANQRLKDATKGIFPDKTSKTPKSVQIDAIRARVKAANEQTKLLKERSEAFQAEKLESDLAKVEARSAVLEKEINEGFSDAKKAKKPISEKLQKAIDERDQLNKMKGELRNALKPKRTPEQIALQSAKTRIANDIANGLERLAKMDAGDFSVPPKRVPKPPDQSLLESLAERDAIKGDINKRMFEYEQANRTKLRKVWDGIKQTGSAFVNIVSSFDFSAPRQALPAILALSTRPIRGWPELAKAVGRMFSGAFSEQRARVIEQKIKNRPNSINGTDKLMGLDLTELNTTKFSKYEDAAHSILDEWAALPYKTGNLAKTIATAPAKGLANLVRGSNRAFITFLNSTRASLADELLRHNYSKKAPTPVQFREVGYLVNLATGRGELSPKIGGFEANPIWSPNLLASRVKLATGMPLWRALATKNPKAMKIVVEEYARVIGSGFLLGSVAMLFDDKDGEPNTSSDYGKIVRGNTRIDLWGGFQQITVVQNRVRTGVSTSIKGKSQDMTAGKFGVDTPIDTLVRFGRSKLKPTWGIAVNMIDRQDFIGRNTDISTEEGRLRVAQSLVPIPLSVNEIAQVMKERGFTEGMIIQSLSTFGAGVSNYEDKEAQR